MRVLVTASRDWTDVDSIRHDLREYARDHPGVHTLVHGDCPTGGDRIAAHVAVGLGWAVEPHPVTEAEWERYGRRAGPLRNAAMVAAGADVCFAFIRNGSRGATGCADFAEAAGIPTYRGHVMAP